jgi:hypothetical protein
MPYSCKLGRLPPKRHIRFRRPDGEARSPAPETLAVDTSG